MGLVNKEVSIILKFLDFVESVGLNMYDNYSDIHDLSDRLKQFMDNCRERKVKLGE
jgi:hemerythrin-like domain-containing protein